MEYSKSSSKREVYTNTILSQETRKISNKQPNLTPQATRERSTKKKKKIQSQEKGKNDKYQCRNELNRDKENNRKDQCN